MDYLAKAEKGTLFDSTAYIPILGYYLKHGILHSANHSSFPLK